MARKKPEQAWIKHPVWIELGFLTSVRLGVAFSREAFAEAAGPAYSENDRWANPNGGYCWGFRPAKTVVITFEREHLAGCNWYAAAGVMAHESQHACEMIAEFIGEDGGFKNEVGCYLLQHIVYNVGLAADSLLKNTPLRVKQWQ